MGRLQRRRWEWHDPLTGAEWSGMGSWAHLDRPGPRPSRPVRSADRSYDVKAEDVVVAGGAALAAMFADEVALWVEAAKLAREFNRGVKRVEDGVGAAESVRDFVRQYIDSPRAGEQPVSRGGFQSHLRRGGYYERRARRFDSGWDDDVAVIPMVYPGKVPPGYRPGLGPGGTRALGSGKIRGSVKYERA